MKDKRKYRDKANRIEIKKNEIHIETKNMANIIEEKKKGKTTRIKYLKNVKRY